jgi:anti-anti-sigma factor
MAQALEIVMAGTPDQPRLVLTGEIDLSTLVTLRTVVDELPRQPPDQLELDLGGVAFMDSTGLGWLAQLARGGCTIGLRSTPPQVRKVLEVSGVDAVVTFLD